MSGTQKVLKKIINKFDLIIPLAALVGAPLCDKFPKLAKELNEDLSVGGSFIGHQEMKAVINACDQLKALCGNDEWVIETDLEESSYYSELENKYKAEITDAFKISIKAERNNKTWRN